MLTKQWALNTQARPEIKSKPQEPSKWVFNPYFDFFFNLKLKVRFEKNAIIYVPIEIEKKKINK